jgi:hypothetical protein
MTRRRWFLTQAIPGNPEIGEYDDGPLGPKPDEDRPPPCPEQCPVAVCVQMDNTDGCWHFGYKFDHPEPPLARCPEVCETSMCIAVGPPGCRRYGANPEPLSVLAEMARDPASGLVEIEPGVYHIAKDVPGGRSTP